MQKFNNWLTREDGQTMAEYGVVLSVIAIAVLGALALLSGGIVNALTRVAGYGALSRTVARGWGLRSEPRHPFHLSAGLRPAISDKDPRCLAVPGP